VRDVGDLIGIRYEARNASGTLVSATVAVTVTAPNGTTSTPSVAPTSTGLYDASFTANAAGVWRWTWTISGTITDVAHDSVDVASPSLTTYVTLPALRDAANINEGDRDGLLQTSLSAAARAVDSYTGRPPGGFALSPAATQRTFTVAGRVSYHCGRHRLRVDELGSVDDLVIEVGDGTTWTSRTVFRTEPDNALVYQEPITRLTSTTDWGWDLARITGRWGWPAIPDQVVEATLITALRFYRRKSTRSNVPDDGGLVRLVDPDVQTLLKPFTPVLIA